MKSSLFAGAMLLAASLPAQAGIQVSVVDDVRPARRIANYLEQVGERYLAPNQDLRVEILDYRHRGQFLRDDLGFGPGWDPWYRGFGYHGRYGWRAPPFGTRGLDSPRIKLRYVLSENGRRVASDTQTIRAWDEAFGMSRSWDDERALRDAVRRWLRRVVADRGED